MSNDRKPTEVHKRTHLNQLGHKPSIAHQPWRLRPKTSRDISFKTPNRKVQQVDQSFTENRKQKNKYPSTKTAERNAF
jgi:hypothetical protein